VELMSDLNYFDEYISRLKSYRPNLLYWSTKIDEHIELAKKLKKQHEIRRIKLGY
jgi:hypothetical protein